MTVSTKGIGMLGISLFITGCMSQQIANTKHMDAAVVNQAAKLNKSPQKVCESASMAMAKGSKQGLYFYAPLHLEQASDNLESGQEKIRQRETLSLGVQQCLKVNKLIENGLAIKAKVKIALKDALNELRMLKRVDSEKKHGEDIQDFADDVRDLVKHIEAGKMNEAMQGQAELLKDMLDLEINMVTDKNLLPVEAMLEKADDINADELADKTFDKAENELESAKKFIRINYRNARQVKKVSAEAMREAKHAYYVAKEVETLKELKPNAAEEKVLYMESLLERINNKINKDAVVGHSLYEQSAIISQRLEKMLGSRIVLNKK